MNQYGKMLKVQLNVIIEVSVTSKTRFKSTDLN